MNEFRDPIEVDLDDNDNSGTGVGVDVKDYPYDPLMISLMFLTKFHDRPATRETVLTGLPLEEGRLTLDSFILSSERMGFIAEVENYSLDAISNMVLPCVLLLKNKDCCVLVKKKSNGDYLVMVPKVGESLQTIQKSDLEEQFTGDILLLQPKFQFDVRSEILELPKTKSWFWGTIVSNWKIYGLALLGTIMVNLFVLASPLFVMNVYDRVVPNTAIETLWVLAIGVSVVALIDFVVKSMRAYFVDVVGKRTDFIISSRMFQQVLNIRLAAKQKSSGVMANTLKEFEALRDFFTSATLTTIGDFPFVLLFVFVIWLFAGPLAYIPLATIPIVLIFAILIQIPLSKIIQQNFRESAQKSAHLFEVMNSIETVKSTGIEGWATKKWETYVGKTALTSMKARILSNLAVHFAQMMLLFTTIGIIVMGVYEIQKGNMTMGALIAAMILSSRALAPLVQFTQLLVRYQQSHASLAALDAIMKTPVERPEGQRFIQRANLNGEIEFRDVSFRYPDEPADSIKGITFKVRQGEKIGVVGRIGAGKSTMLKLIMNLYQPSSGSILVDGIDIRQIDPNDLRRNIGYVLQDNILFFGSVRDNITMKAPYVDDEQILRAAQIAGVDMFVRQHPLGYDAPVGERGEFLSGGQRQSIVIARALLQDPPIMLLDEPTGQMDHTSQRMFLSRLKTDMRDKTIILVTHRTALLEVVDRLIVVDKGEIVADGPKETVLKALTEQ